MTQQDAINWARTGWVNSRYTKRINGNLGIDTDGYYGFQCKDFVNAYGEWLGHPLKAGNARTLWEQPQDPWYQKVSSPQPGDISVFAPAPANGNAGHTDIVVGPGFTSVAQNWGVGSNGVTGLPPATVSHTMNGVYGFLRPQFNQGGVDMSLTRAQMGQVMWLSIRRQGGVTDPEYNKYKDNVDDFFQYVQNVQVENNYPDFNPAPAGVKPYDGPALFVKQ